MSTETMAGRPESFGLTVPDHWARFDLSDAPLAQARREALKTARDPVTRMEVDDVFRQARAVSKAARRRGALWGAGTVTIYDDALFVGHVMVFAINPGDDVDMSLPTLTRQLSRTGATDGGERPTWPRTVLPVTLPGVGDAVRIVGTELVTITANAEVEMLTMHTLIPVPGGGGDQFMVTCCSPNVPLAEQVYELFAAISATFQFAAVAPN